MSFDPPSHPTRRNNGSFVPPPRTDEELVAACRAGERQAFVEIVQRHQSLVCAVAYNTAGRLDVSEEVAQDTFVTAWRKIDELREPAKLRGWLTRIAHALAVDWVRKQKPGVSLDELAHLAAPEAAPDEAAATGEESALVWKALEALPEATRLPLILFYREGQSIAAVAVALELSEDAVRQRLSRGRAALRDRLADVAEAVLGRTRPCAVFTFAVMAAIGALAAPAALAATAFAGGSAVAASATAGVAAQTTSSTTTSIFATMSASKATLATAAALVALSIPVGWSVREHRQAHATAGTEVPLRASSEERGERTTSDFKASVLYVEWQRLHEEHGTTREAMPALYQAIAKISDTFRRRAFRAALIAEWVELDAAGALGHFRAQKNSDLSEQTMREWMLRDPRLAVAGLMSSGAGWEAIGRSLLPEMVRLTPELLPAVVAQLPKSDQDSWDTSVKDPFAALAGRNLESARAEAEALSGPNRDQALAGVAAAWAARDPQAALVWTQALPEGETRNETLRGLLLGWAKTDPAAALDHVDLAPPGADQMNYGLDVGSMMLAAAAEKDFGGTMRWLQANPGKLGSQSMNGLMNLLSDKLVADTPGTLTFLKNDAPAGMNRVLSNSLLNKGYARAGEIRAWLDAQPPGDFVDGTRMALINATAGHDPTALVDWVKEMPEAQKTPEKLREIAIRLLNGGSDFSRIDDLIATSPPDLRLALIDAGFGQGGRSEWPGGDVKPWLARLEEVAPQDRARSSAFLAQNWAATDPEAAIAWAGGLPDDQARMQSYAAIAGRWARADSYEASQWIATLPAGTERDAATRALVGTIAPAEPDSAWTWAQHIADPNLRRDSMAEAIAAWAKVDPASGRAALAQTPEIDGEARAHLEAILADPDRGAIPAGRPQSLPATR